MAKLSEFLPALYDAPDDDDAPRLAMTGRLQLRNGTGLGL